MRILITNCDVATRGGAQGTVRDIAQGLQERGHQAVIYSANPTEDHTALRGLDLPVCTDIRRLPFSPDLIHAQHNPDAMAAIFGLPGVPAVYYCHGAVWNEMQPRHPRIRRYLAMSRTLKQRMMIESNLRDEEVEVVLNWVDLGRFHRPRKPPEKLRKALLYNAFLGERCPVIPAIRQACEDLGLDLDSAGRKVERQVKRPEEELREYDLVFASGKSAIDALACGCAVIILGLRSCGPLVTPANFAALREVNFSIAANCPPVTTAEVRRELERYRPEDTDETAVRTHRECDRSTAVDRLIRIYEEVLTENPVSEVDDAGEINAAITYLRSLTPLIKMMPDQTEVQGKRAWTQEDVQELSTAADVFLAEMARFR